MAESLKERLFSMAYASSSNNNSSDLYPVVLWFFPALITGLLMTFAIWKIPAGWKKVVGIMGVKSKRLQTKA